MIRDPAKIDKVAKHVKASWEARKFGYQSKNAWIAMLPTANATTQKAVLRGFPNSDLMPLACIA